MRHRRRSRTSISTGSRVTLTVMSASLVSSIASRVLVAGMAMLTRITIGTTVHRISMVVLSWNCAATAPLDLRWLTIEIDHRTEHHDADHAAHPEDDHVRVVHALAGGDSFRMLSAKSARADVNAPTSNADDMPASLYITLTASVPELFNLYSFIGPHPAGVDLYADSSCATPPQGRPSRRRPNPDLDPPTGSTDPQAPGTNARSRRSVPRDPAARKFCALFRAAASSQRHAPRSFHRHHRCADGITSQRWAACDTT